MEERIKEKIKSIENFIEEIYSWLPEEYEDYAKDARTRAACQNNFEVISEYLVELAIYIIRLKKFRIPNDDESTFQILAENKIISEDLCERMINLRGMRNFIVHRYGEIDNLKVFIALAEEFRDDVEEFIKNINHAL